MKRRRTTRRDRMADATMGSHLRGGRASWRIALVALSLLGAPSAWASPPATAKAELDAAFADLDALARRTRQAGGLPRWSDPEGSRVLGRLWNMRAILGAPPFAAVDIPVLLDIFDRQNAVYKTYLLFTAAPGELPDTAANTVRYQDEITRAAAALLHVVAAEMDAIEAFWASLPADGRTPVRRAGAQQMRAGMVEFVTGALTGLRLPQLTPDNSRILTQALTETADALARALPRPDRTALGAQAAAAAAALPPETRDRLAPIIAAFARTECTSLCAIE